MTFDTDYQHDLLARMSDPKFLELVSGMLSPAMFDVELQPVAKEILKRKKLPSTAQVRQICRRNGVVLKGSRSGDYSYDLKEIQTFVQHRLMRDALDEAHGALDKFDYPGVVAAVNKAHSRFPRTGNNGIVDVASAPLKMPKRDRLVSLGVAELDEHFKGGIAAEELFMVMAPTSGGKTTFLVHLACLASKSGKNVYYLTVDLAGYKVHRKMRSCLCQEEEPSEKLWGKKRKLLKGKLWIDEHPASTLDATSVEGLLPEGVDLLIVDYADNLLLPKGYVGQDYSGLGRIYKELRRISFNKRIPVATASQLNRGDRGRTEGRLEDVEMSYQKGHVCDLAVSIHQTGQDKETQKRCSLFIAKNNVGPRYIKIDPVTVHWETCTFEEGSIAS